jgi:hypothetical protein
LINPNLHRQPVPLDSNQHRGVKIAVPITDWSLAGKLNAVFTAAVEFGDTCREFPIVFVKAGKDEQGNDEIAPIAVFGLVQDQNLYVAGERWRAQYMPAVLRLYPFCIGRLDAERFAICLDMAFKGVGSEGQALFDAEGKPMPLLEEVRKNMEAIEGEIQRTRLFGKKLQELGVLVDMRFDATLPDGKAHTVDGFLTVDEKKMQDLPDNVVGELHRTGVLALIHHHWVSLGNMRRLVDWHVERSAAAPAPAVAAAAANS